MMHPHTRVQFIGDEVGQGVVATAFIPKGTVTWVQDPLDRVFSPSEGAALPAASQGQLEYFAFKNGKENHGTLVVPFWWMMGRGFWWRFEEGKGGQNHG